MIELRCVDRPPIGYEFAPVAFWVGLLSNDKIKNKLIELFLSWESVDRKLSINNTDNLNLQNIGPQQTSMYDWICYFSELALEGLSYRSNLLSIRNEEDLFLPYLELFQYRGAPGLFRQNDYINSKKSLKEFIKMSILGN
jgi:gamma-glutamylcysteine synthetase